MFYILQYAKIVCGVTLFFCGSVLWLRLSVVDPGAVSTHPCARVGVV